jgi:hypothetical protein
LGLKLETLNLRLKYLRKKGVLVWFANGQALDATTVTKFDTATMEEIQQRKKKYQDMVSANQASQKMKSISSEETTRIPVNLTGISFIQNTHGSLLSAIRPNDLKL